MTDKYCEDCKGTGIIETELIILGRLYCDKEQRKVLTPYETDSIWTKTVCHCKDD